MAFPADLAVRVDAAASMAGKLQERAHCPHAIDAEFSRYRDCDVI